MKFLWPEMLWILLIVPALVAAYFFLLRRKKEAALRYASLSMVKEALGARQRFRRHIPPLLFLVALIVMIVGIARPAAVITLPFQHQMIILAMDVSGSMRAVDVQPNRISAAQAAAKAFVAEQPSNVRIGVVSFAATASVVQMPTQNHEDILAAIDRFQLQRGTAIGSGIIVALATIFPEEGIDVSSLIYGRDAAARHTSRSAWQSGETGVQAGSTRLVHIRRHHFAHRRPEDHGPRLLGGGPHGRRPRRSCLHRGFRHHRRRDHRL